MIERAKGEESLPVKPPSAIEKRKGGRGLLLAGKVPLLCWLKASSFPAEREGKRELCHPPREGNGGSSMLGQGDGLVDRERRGLLPTASGENEGRPLLAGGGVLLGKRMTRSIRRRDRAATETSTGKKVGEGTEEA